MSIKVEALTKLYGSQKAIDAISFSAAPGILGFLGPNGAGKSTTMKILSGFVPQTSGTANVCGFDTAMQSLEVRRLIGYLPENNPLYTDMYVKESLNFMAGIHGLHKPENRVAGVIEQTGLGPEQYKKIGQLSKGYRQRVGLAQAILHDPEVLILDEPTSGLDPNQLIGIRQLIKDLGVSKTIILSTHIMQEVEAVCDRVVIINKGKIVADDSLSVLKDRYNGQSLENIFVELTYLKTQSN
jgi:ABC-2 type transport system ATP-binding protein